MSGEHALLPIERERLGRLLAEWNPDEASERLDTALSFLARVRDSFGLDDRFALSALLCEASCYYLLSKRGQSPIDNLKKALNCLTDANAWRARLHDVDVFMAVTEASVRKDLAEHGIDPADNLRKAINRCIDAGANLAATSRYRDFLLLSRAAAHARLADFGIDSINNLKAAAFLCGECDHSGPGLVPIVLKARLDAATVLQKLVYWGVEPREKLDQALSVYFELLEASSGSASENPRIRELVTQTLAEIANTYGTMAVADVARTSSSALHAALSFVREARERLRSDGQEDAALLLNEAVFCLALAKGGHKAAENVERAKQLATKAAAEFDHGSHKWAASQLILADALRTAGESEASVHCLTASLAAFEGTRSQLSGEADRSAYTRVLFQHYETVVRT